MMPKKPKPATFTRAEIPEACKRLVELQRRRVQSLTARNALANRLRAMVASTLGYDVGDDEAARKAKQKEAQTLIDWLVENPNEPHELRGLVDAMSIGIDAAARSESETTRTMTKIAERFPVAAWINQPEQRGISCTNLAYIVGETGDLANYANPAKVWRRMGCAPHTFKDKTLMGATWRRGKDGALPASEWETYGQSCRRRAVAFNVGHPLMLTNDGPYRARFDKAKAKIAASHPDYSKMRCQLHGELLMTKLLLKNLWIEWNRP